MARKPAEKSAPPKQAPEPSKAAPKQATDSRRAALDALMQLAAEADWQDIDLTDIAERAGISLSELRGLFTSKGAMLAAFSRQIDQIVLDGIDPGMEAEPARERLFDTLMRRADALLPYRPAIARLSKSFARDPL